MSSPLLSLRVATVPLPLPTDDTVKMVNRLSAGAAGLHRAYYLPTYPEYKMSGETTYFDDDDLYQVMLTSHTGAFRHFEGLHVFKESRSAYGTFQLPNQHVEGHAGNINPGFYLGECCAQGVAALAGALDPAKWTGHIPLLTAGGIMPLNMSLPHKSYDAYITLYEEGEQAEEGEKDVSFEVIGVVRVFRGKIPVCLTIVEGIGVTEEDFHKRVQGAFSERKQKDNH